MCSLVLVVVVGEPLTEVFGLMLSCELVGEGGEVEVECLV